MDEPSPESKAEARLKAEEIIELRRTHQKADTEERDLAQLMRNHLRQTAVKCGGYWFVVPELFPQSNLHVYAEADVLVLDDDKS